jgi:serine/threonine protein kinase
MNDTRISYKIKQKINNIRRTKRIGGRILGKGSKGTVMDMCYKKDKHAIDSLCKKFNKEEIDKIALYRDHRVKTHIETSRFLQWLQDPIHTTGKIVKEFTDEDAFKDEMKEGKTILHAYRKTPEYISLEGSKTIDDIEFIGFSITLSSWKTYYYLISKICDTNYDIDTKSIVEFIENLLESIKVLNSAGVYHNDIKPANIVYCDKEKRFNLIDWGASKKVTTIESCKKRGDPVFSSPMKLYIVYSDNLLVREQNVPKHTLQYELLTKKKDWNYIWDNKKEPKGDEKQEAFLTRFYYLLDEQYGIFLSQLKNLHSISRIFKKYKRTFDIYMLGMTIYHIIFKYNVGKKDKLHELVKLFINLENPLDANQAISVFHKWKQEFNKN